MAAATSHGAETSADFWRAKTNSVRAGAATMIGIVLNAAAVVMEGFDARRGEGCGF